MAIICKYKFNSTLCADYLPEFNNEFVDYTKTDVDNGDNTITRTIEHDSLLPTLIRFGGDNATDRERSLLELIECDTSNVTSMWIMFKNCTSLTSLDLSSFDTSNVTNMQDMFANCTSLVSLNISSFDTSKVTSMQGIFYNCNKLTSLDVSNFNTSKVTSMAYMFYKCFLLTTLDLSSFDTSNVINMAEMFNSCSSLTSLNISNFNTSNVTNMSWMFNNCTSLTTLDLSSFDTSNVINMCGMFNDCNKLTSLDLSSFNTNKVTDMSWMFNSCRLLTTLDLSNFDTSKVVNMDKMFNNCKSLTSLDLSNFNTSNVTNMRDMFSSCISLTSLNISNFDTTNVNIIRGMFYNCSSLTLLDVSNFNTSNTTDMSGMFYDCTSLISLDLSSFNTISVTDISNIFKNTPKLQDIGMVYCDKSTIDKVSSLIGHTCNIYVNSVIPDDCTPVEGITFIYDGNTIEMNHEPLRAVGEVKDKYVLIDGKWFIERNVGKYIYTGKESWSPVDDDRTTDTARTFLATYTPPNAKVDGNLNTFKSNKLPNKMYSSSDLGIWIDIHTFITLPRNEVNTVAELKLWLQSNPITGLYQLKTPQYEEIDYNPLEVYSDITHITTNSIIPHNITVKNHGYNCMLKPSTTYTVSSNLGINTITTPAELTEDYLRFYDEDTSNADIMKDVLVLEGDWTTKADLIPANFSGIESAFEQELVTDENDVNYGKYKVTAKVVGKNLFDKNIEFLDGYYLSDEDGTNTRLDGYCVSKDYIRIQPNTTYYGTYMGHIALYDKHKNFIRRYALWDSEKTFTTSSNAYYLRYQFGSNDDFNIIQLEQGSKATEYEPYKENNITFYINEPLRRTATVRDKICIKDDKVVVQRNCGSYIINDGSNFRIDNHNNISRNRVNRFVFDGVLLPNSKDLGDTGCSNICDILPVVSSIDTQEANSECISIRGFIDVWGVIICVKQPSVASFNQWLQQNPITIVYELAEPVYEEVEYSSNRLILNTFNNESFNNSTLLLNTNISPKISLKPLFEELAYVKPNTKYYIQFNAVGSGEVVINLGGTELTTEIVEGYNCIPITTPNESTNLMTISGQGITISEVIVSEVVCGGYYKGLQSCFEEHMENGKYRVLLRGIALDGSKVNGIKLYINEPLRGIGDVKDRLCIKNGKLMVERKCGSVTFDGSDDECWIIQSSNTTNLCSQYYITVEYGDTGGKNIALNYINDTFKKLGTKYGEKADKEGMYTGWSGLYINIFNSKLSEISNSGIKQWLQSNPIRVVYQLAEPIYEEVTNEYGLPIIFEGYENGIVYIDSAVTPTTHIKYTSNNQLATTLAEAEEQNIATQEDINMNVITYMMDIDMMLTDMEMSNDISVMAVRRDSSNENMLDRMSDEDKKVYRDNTVVMLEKMITANVLEKEDIEGRIDMYYNKNRISKEQYKYLKSLL